MTDPDTEPTPHPFGVPDSDMEPNEYVDHQQREAEKITPMALTIHYDGDHVRVHGPALDIVLLRNIAALNTDATALATIQNVWGVDRDTARVLLRAARDGEESQ